VIGLVFDDAGAAGSVGPTGSPSAIVVAVTGIGAGPLGVLGIAPGTPSPEPDTGTGWTLVVPGRILQSGHSATRTWNGSIAGDPEPPGRNSK